MLILLGRLWGHINPTRRVHLVILFVVMICASFAEFLSIGMVIPFLGVLTNPDLVFGHQDLKPILKFFKIGTSSDLLLPMTFVFIFAVISSSLIRFVLVLLMTRTTLGITSEIAVSIYMKILCEPYEVHIRRNSSEVISGVLSKVGVGIGSTIGPLILILSTVFIVLMIIIPLLIYNPIETLYSFLALGGIYATIVLITKKRLLLSSLEISRASNEIIKVLQEGLGGIREILLEGNQSTYGLIFRNTDLRLRKAQASIQIIGSSPKFAIEALGITGISFMAYWFSTMPGGLLAVVPLLGAVAIGAQKLFPMLQQAFSSWTLLQGGRESLRDVLDLLDRPRQKQHEAAFARKDIPFEAEIRIDKLSFRYTPDGPDVLREISLVLTKGGRIGFIGATGSGKSTLLDVLMGLLQPTKGAIFVDGRMLDSSSLRGWQARIAHVPQSIFLADSTIAENIAFGVPRDSIDYDRVKSAAQKAQLSHVIEALALQYDSPVGERGVQLSGGQRQRIGIARALYKKADLIVLDEATSALDIGTEQEVTSAINSLGEGITILIVAHRLATLKNCTEIIELSNGEIARVCNYADINGR